MTNLNPSPLRVTFLIVLLCLLIYNLIIVCNTLDTKFIISFIVLFIGIMIISLK